MPPEEIFSDYAYFSSYSDCWLDHAARFAERRDRPVRPGRRTARRRGREQRRLPAAALRRRAASRCSASSRPPTSPRSPCAAGVPTEVRVLRRASWRERLVDRGAARRSRRRQQRARARARTSTTSSPGWRALLKPGGVVSIEVPHLLRLIERTEFDTIYHEHFSYFSLLAAQRALRAGTGCGSSTSRSSTTHGGSLRSSPAATGRSRARPTAAVVAVVARERDGAGLDRPDGYVGFAARVERLLRRAAARSSPSATRGGARGRRYGAAAKGNTLLNCRRTARPRCRLRRRPQPAQAGPVPAGLATADPRSRRVRRDRPDYLLILPWNLRDEITEQMADRREWGGRFVVPVPASRLVRERPTSRRCRRVHRRARAGHATSAAFRPHVLRGTSSRRPGSTPRRPVQRVFNPRRGTLRGMHFQQPPHEEAKLVRCIARPDLRRRRRPPRRLAHARLGWLAVELSAERRNAFFVPPGPRPRVPHAGTAASSST